MQEQQDHTTEEARPRPCELTPAELRALRMRSLEYLIREWPVLDKRCERISDTVLNTKNYGCMIVEGPRHDESCELPSHFGYGIVFDKETLNPIEIRWLTGEKRE